MQCNGKKCAMRTCHMLQPNQGRRHREWLQLMACIHSFQNTGTCSHTIVQYSPYMNMLYYHSGDVCNISLRSIHVCGCYLHYNLQQ